MTVRERWVAIVTEYTDKGAYAQTELRTKFLESRCPEKGNVREFLEGLRVKREELAQVGVDIENKDYLSTIVGSLPFALSNFTSSQLTAARMFSTTKTIDLDTLILLLVEESDRQRAQYARRKTGGKGKEGEKDKALSVASDKGKKPRKMLNAGIAVRRVTSVTSARNQRRPTPRRTSPRSKPKQMAELTLLNPTQKVRVHGHWMMIMIQWPLMTPCQTCIRFLTQMMTTRHILASKIGSLRRLIGSQMTMKRMWLQNRTQALSKTLKMSQVKPL